MALSVGEIEATLRLRDHLTAELLKAGREARGFGATVKDVAETAAEAGGEVVRAFQNIEHAILRIVTLPGRVRGAILDPLTNGVEAVGKKLTTHVTLPLGGMAAAALKASTDFESAFTGVKKTVDGVVDDFGRITAAGKQIEQGIRDMALEMPVAARDLARIAEVGGQLGVAEKNVLQFTRVVAMIGEATTLSTEQAAVGLARLANVTQEPQENFDRMGSTLAKLGDTAASTEGEILEFAERIGATAKLAGLGVADVLAFGTAMSDVGVKAEAGGTVLNKVFAQLFEAVKTGSAELVTFADTANMTVEEFKTAFNKDAAGATVAFIKGLQRISKEGGNVFEVLRDVEFQDVRMKQALLSVATAGDRLTQHLATARQEWVTNTKLQQEFQLRAATTASLISALWARVVDLAISIGNALNPGFRTLIAIADILLIPVQALVKAFSLLPGPIQAVVIGFVAMTAALGPLLIALTALVHTVALLGLLSTINAALGVFSGSTSAAAGVVTAFTAKFTPLGAMLLNATGATRGLSTALLALTGYLRMGATAVVGWVTPMFTLSNILRVVGTAISGSVGLFTRLGAALLGLVNWPLTLAAAFGVLLYSIPPVHDVINDLLGIIVELGRIGIAFLRIGFEELALGVRETWSAFKDFVAVVRDVNPHINAMITFVERVGGWFVSLAAKIRDARQALKEYREGLEQVSSAPKPPKPPDLPKPQSIKPALDGVQALAMDLGFVGDQSDYAAQNLVILASAMEDARMKAQNLSSSQKTYLNAAIREGSTDLEKMAENAKTTVGAVKAYKEGLDKTTESQKKFSDLQKEISGQSVVTKLLEMTTAIKGIGGAQNVTTDAAQAFSRMVEQVERRFGSLERAGLGSLRAIATELERLSLREFAEEISGKTMVREADKWVIGLDMIGGRASLTKAKFEDLGQLLVDLEGRFGSLEKAGVGGVDKIQKEIDELIASSKKPTVKMVTVFQDQNPYAQDEMRTIETKIVPVFSPPAGVDSRLKALRGMAKDAQDGLAALNRVLEEFKAKKQTEIIKDALTDLDEFWRKWRQNVFEKGSAELHQFDEAFQQNADTIKQLRDEYAELATAFGADTLTNRLAGVTVQFRRQRDAITEAQKKASNYGEVVDQIAKNELMALAGVHEEWLRGGELTRKELDLLAKDAEARFKMMRESGRFTAEAVYRAWEEAWERMRRAQHRGAFAFMDNMQLLLRGLGQALDQIAGLTTGRLSDIVKWMAMLTRAIDQAYESATTLGKGLSALGKGFSVQGVKDVVTGFASVTASMLQATSAGSTFQRTVGGALAGAAAGAGIGLAFAPATLGLSVAIGAVGGALVGLVRGFGAAKEETKQANAEIAKIRGTLLDSYGGFKRLEAAAASVGMSFKTSLYATGKDALERLQTDVERFQRSIELLQEDVQRFGLTWNDLNIEAQQREVQFRAEGLIESFRRLTTAGYSSASIVRGMSVDLNQLVIDALRAGTKIPAAFRPILEALIRTDQLSAAARRALLGLADAGPTLEEITAAAQRYGIELDALGPKVQQLRIDEVTRQIVADWKLFEAAGVDMNAVMAGMVDEMQEIVTTALRMGLEIPAAMRPILQRFVDAGELVDENGEKLKDLSRFNFAKPLEELLDALIKKLDELVEAIRGRVIPAFRDLGRVEPPRVPVPGSGRDEPGGPGGPGGKEGEQFAAGTPGLDFRHFGRATSATLHGMEAVIPQSGVGSLAAQIASALAPRLPSGGGSIKITAPPAKPDAAAGQMTAFSRTIAGALEEVVGVVTGRIDARLQALADAGATIADILAALGPMSRMLAGGDEKAPPPAPTVPEDVVGAVTAAMTPAMQAQIDAIVAALLQAKRPEEVVPLDAPDEEAIARAVAGQTVGDLTAAMTASMQALLAKQAEEPRVVFERGAFEGVVVDSESRLEQLVDRIISLLRRRGQRQAQFVSALELEGGE